MLPGWGQIVHIQQSSAPCPVGRYRAGPWEGGQGRRREGRQEAGGGSGDVDERKVEGSDIRAKWLESLQG